MRRTEMSEHDFPYHPRDWDSTDIDEAVRYYRTLSVKELRKRQSLTEAQSQIASSKQMDETLWHLEVMSKCLDCAISLKQFGEPMWQDTHV